MSGCILNQALLQNVFLESVLLVECLCKVNIIVSEYVTHGL